MTLKHQWLHVYLAMERTKLELGDISMSGGHGTIATGESASFFDRLYEKEAIMDTYR